MRKSLVKEVAFGKAIAKVTVTAFTEPKRLDGWEVGEEVILTEKVEIIANGKVVERGHFANVLEYNNLTDTFYEKGNLDPAEKYTKVGDKALTKGAESGIAINAAIKKLTAELAKEFNIETEEEKQRKQELAEAKVVIQLAEKQGVENLMTSEQLRKWESNYNRINNEGGEGYIPVKVSKEEYQKALEVINNG